MLGSNLWLPRSSALRPWLRKTISTVKSTLLSFLYLFFMWTAASLMGFLSRPAESVNFRHSTVVSPKLDLGAKSLSSGCRGFLWYRSSVFRKCMCLVWNPPSAEICLGRASHGQPWQILLPSWDKWQVLVWRGSYRSYLRRGLTDWRQFQGRMFFCFIASRSDCCHFARSQLWALFWDMDGVVIEAEIRAVTMLSKSASVSFIFSSDGCVWPVVMLRSIAFWSLMRVKSSERVKFE